MNLDEQKDSIVADFHSQIPYWKIAERHSVSEDQIRAYLRKLQLRRRTPRPSKFDVQAIVEDWKIHKNYRKLAEDWGISKSQASRLITWHIGGIGKGNKWNPDIDGNRDAIICRYNNGECCRKIAESFSTDAETIRLRLKKWGVQRRLRGQYEPRGQDNWNWNGGVQKTPDSIRKIAYEVVDQYIGKQRRRGLVIHHIDENPANNDPLNIMIFLARRDHLRLHKHLLRLRHEGLEFDASQEALKFGAQGLIQFAYQIR